MPNRCFRPDPPEYTDFSFFNIVSQMPDYRLAFNLNRSAGFNLKKISDLVVYTGKSPVQCSTYFYYDDVFRINYFLIKNYNSPGILVPSLKNIDYFLLADGFSNHRSPTEFIRHIRDIQGILAVLQMPADKMKEGKYILEDLEMHLMCVFDS